MTAPTTEEEWERAMVIVTYLADDCGAFLSMPEDFVPAFERLRASVPFMPEGQARELLLTLGDLSTRAGHAVLARNWKEARHVLEDFYRALLADTN